MSKIFNIIIIWINFQAIKQNQIKGKKLPLKPVVWSECLAALEAFVGRLKLYEWQMVKVQRFYFLDKPFLARVRFV